MTPEQQRALAIARARRRRAEAEAQPNTWADMAKSAASGVAQGAIDLAGLPGAIDNAVTGGLDWLKTRGYEAVMGEPAGSGFFAPLDNSNRPLGGRNPLSGGVLREAASAATGGATEYRPQTTAGEYAQTVGSFLPGAAAFGGASIGNVARFGVLPGAASEAAGQVTEGTAAEPYARLAAALLAPAIPAVASRAVTPFPIDANRARMAQSLQREGIDLTAGQRAGSDRLRYMESEIGGSRAANMAERQGEQFTAATLRRAGVNANRATPEVIDDAFETIGKRFDDLAANNTLVPDAELAADVQSAVQNYNQLVPQSARAPVIANLSEDIGAAIQNGTVSGSTYQSLRSRIERMARGTRDPDTSMALREMKDALDAGMERSIAQNNPADAGAWREVRNQYRNMLTIERAATGAGENAALGLISPSRLRSVASTGSGRRAYARGKGDFSELARSGEALMRPLPNSGTAGRLNAQNLGAGLSSILGAGAGSQVGGASGAMLGALAGAAVPRVAGAAMMSRPGQAYLTNQLLGEVPVFDPRYAAIAEALFASSDGQLSGPR